MDLAPSEQGWHNGVMNRNRALGLTCVASSIFIVSGILTSASANAAASAAPAPAAAPIDPKVKYAVQLAKMKEMGFINEEVNLDALKATNGIIDAAIERIINMLK